MSQTAIPAELRRRIAETARYRCCYCLSQEEIVGMRFTVDHIVPESLGGATLLENLCLACWDCNLFKRNRLSAIDPLSGRTFPLFNPNQQDWHAHFAWRADGIIVAGITSTGRATVHALQLNRHLLVQARRRWVKAGWHPPVD